MRRHGCQNPLDGHQIGSWVLFIGLAACCYALQLPVVAYTKAYLALVVLYTCMAALVLGLNISCTLSDPSDPGTHGKPGGEYYCSLCSASVSNTSKHCRACDRCVDGFDHHCKWLNNCIGRANYNRFFMLVCASAALLTVQLSCALWQFITSFTWREDMQLNVQLAYHGNVKYQGWQAMLALYMLVLLAAVGLLSELLTFHLVLIARKMSTYDFIVAQRESQLGGPPMPTRAASIAGLFKRLLLCQTCLKPSQVHDEATSVQARRAKVSLNPCAACTAAKPDAPLQQWQRQGLGTPMKGSTSSPFPAGMARNKLTTMETSSGAAYARVGQQTPPTPPYPQPTSEAVSLWPSPGASGGAQALGVSGYSPQAASDYNTPQTSPYTLPLRSVLPTSPGGPWGSQDAPATQHMQYLPDPQLLLHASSVQHAATSGYQPSVVQGNLMGGSNGWPPQLSPPSLQTRGQNSSMEGVGQWPGHSALPSEARHLGSSPSERASRSGDRASRTLHHAGASLIYPVPFVT